MKTPPKPPAPRHPRRRCSHVMDEMSIDPKVLAAAALAASVAASTVAVALYTR